MSRGIKDLRELICVSRLTYRDSDEELDFSDDEGRASRLSMLGQRLEVLSIDSETDYQQTASQAIEPGTPDSGIITNGLDETGVQSASPKPPIEPRPPSNRKRKPKKKTSQTVSAPDLVTLHELPKPSPLPPVSNTVCLSPRPSSSSSESTSSSSSSLVRRIGGDKGPRVGPARTRNINYDQLLSYLDPSVVGEWLEQTDNCIQKLTQWVHTKDNFVKFANFWLNNFTDKQKQEIFQLEHSIVLDNLEFGFKDGRESAKIKHRDLIDFLSAIFREYPAKIMSAKSPHMFLDYLDILTSERTKSYKKLLSDVKCSTRNRQFAQLVLACRCFTLASVWSAVINFYCRLVGESDSGDSELPDMSKLKPNNQRMYMAVRLGFLDVVYYLLVTGKIRTTFKDPSDRTLLFTAVMNNQPKILHFLLYNVRPIPDVNQAAETGNTPLHAAAHCGYAEVASILLAYPATDKNPCNKEMDGATPLHLATLQGNADVVKVLLEGGCDRNLTMGGITAEEIARDFGQKDIVQIFQQFKDS